VTRKKDFLGLAPRLQTNHITGQPTNVFVIGKNRKEWAPVAANKAIIDRITQMISAHYGAHG